jgi:hypothetical protein
MTQAVKVESDNFDAEIKHFRIKSADKRRFVEKCKEANTTTSAALRSLIQAVNAGRIVLE